MLSIIELELELLDMQINAKKSNCLRIGDRCNAPCASIYTADGPELEWTDTVKYLGVYLITAKKFTCSFDNAKKSFYRTFNSIFSKVGRIASEEVILELVNKKCMPAMLFGLDACTINKSQINSLQFAVTGMLMKLFCTRSKDIVNESLHFFGFSAVDILIYKRQYNFLMKYSIADNLLCHIFANIAVNELNNVKAKLKELDTTRLS